MNDPHLHLLVDDDEVDARWHVTRVIARPDARTAEPVLRPDRAWEGRAAGLSGTVLRDGPNGAYRLWYRSFHDGRPESDRNFLNYAESADGLAWKKPALRLIEYEGDRDTNIVYRPSVSGLRSFESNGLVIDEVGAPERRYKLVAHHGFEDKSRNGLFGLFSPDGMRWTVTDRPLLPGAGDRHGALKDPVTGEYVVFTRSPRFKARARGRDDPDSAPLPYKRIVGRTTSRDFVNWSPFRTVLRNDGFDAPGTQFYSISPFRYGNRLLAFVDVYDTDVERMWVSLASSLDGIRWNRPLRGQPILGLGPEGRWDDTWVNVTNNPPVPEGDRLRFWYVGRTTGHGLSTRTGALGSFLLTRDRFAGLTAGRRTGTIVTAPVQVGGPNLYVNANLRNGRMSVAVADALGGPIEGLGMSRCSPLAGDNIDHEMRWDGNAGLGTLRGRLVRLHVEITYGTLFAFRFGDARRC